MIKRLFFALLLVVTVSFVFQAKVDWPQESQAQKNKAWTDGAPADFYTPSSALTALNQAFRDLGKTLAPTVVNIFTVSKVPSQNFGGMYGPEADLFRYFFGNPMGPGPNGRGREREANSAGSGFVINKQGLIVTNSHVVRINDRIADQIRVKFIADGNSSQGTPAEVVGVDPLTDVAVLKLKGLGADKLKDLKVAPLGNSDEAAVGEIVFAVGNPYGHTHSVTQGIISALGREVDINASNFIQTDTSINPGNSGGPLFNIRGEVIGINTAIDARAQGIGFAIPINSAKRVIEQLVDKGSVTWGYVGVSMQPLDEQIAKSLGLKDERGVLIVGVEEGGPAHKAGIRAYDVVTKLGNKDIQSVRDLSITVRALGPGVKTDVEVIREGRKLKLPMVVGKRPQEEELASRGRREEAAPSGKANAKLGVELVDLSPQLRSKFQIDSSVKGVLVTSVTPGGMGEQMGLVPGDLITEINKKAVTTQKEVSSALAANSKGILLKVQNRNAERVLYVEFGE